MTPQELKNSILQLAIQGKLVEQRPEEGTAEELFAQIQEEKQQLIAEKKIKKEKPLPEITEDEKPFDIPESWKWVRLGDITSKLTDGSHNPPPNTGSGYPVISAKNVKSGLITFENVDRFTDNEGFEKENPRTNIIKGDIIMGIIGGSIGNVAIYTHDIKVIAQRSIAIMRFLISTDFSRILLESPLIQNKLTISTSGSAQGGVYLGTLKNLAIPLPPLAEQKRIVAKIEELLPYIDRYEQAWGKLEQFNSRFPEDMKKSLLQYAIQGKLVEQRPEDGTAEELFTQIHEEKQRLIAEKKIKKEKPLPEITEDDKPFDIPESWKWVRFSDVIDVRDGTHDTPKYVLKGIPLVTSKNLVSGKIDFDTAKLISEEDAATINMRSEVNTGDILFAMIGTIGNPVLVKKDREFCIKNMALFKPIDNHLFDMSYLLLFLQKEQEQMKKSASGGVQSFVSLKFLRNYLLPLPPLAEQKRIVEKLEQLLPLCERLK